MAAANDSVSGGFGRLTLIVDLAIVAQLQVILHVHRPRLDAVHGGVEKPGGVTEPLAYGETLKGK